MNYSQKIALKKGLLIVTILLLLILPGLIMLPSKISDIISGKTNLLSALILGLGIFFMTLGIIMALLFSRLENFLDKLAQEMHSALNGNRGEKLVVKELRSFLDPSKYTIYRNFQIPGKHFDIDVLVLGPSGLIALEVKNWSKEVNFFHDHYEEIIWTSKDGQKIFRPTDDPREKLSQYCEQLNAYISENDHSLKNLRIDRAVALINNNIKIKDYKTGTYIICGINKLKYYFTQLNRREVQREEIEEIKKILNR